MKARFLSLLAVVLCLVSCQRDADDLNVAMGGEQDVMLTVSLPEATRASSEEGFDLSKLGTTYDLRYILEIYRVDANGVVLYDNCQRFVETSDNSTMVFPVRLAPGYNYRIVAWADIVDEGSEVDRCYTTTNGLDAIEIIENMWKPMDETRDAYTGLKIINVFSSASDLDMELTRPFAKVRVVATDITDIREVGLEPTTATMTYSQNMYYKYNAVADVENKGVAEGAKAKSHTYTYAQTATQYTDNDDELTLFTDYIFVPSTGTAKFNLTVKDANSTEIKTNNFNTDIFVQRNTLTTIKGDVLTLGENIVVNVDGTITEGDTHAVVNSAEDLQQMINNAADDKETNISLGGNIDLGAIAGILSTRAAQTAGLVIPADKSVVLDLNGFTLSYSDKTWGNSMIENFGTLTLKGEGTVAYEFAGDADTSNSKGNYAIANRGTLVIDGPTVETTASKAVAGEKFSHALYTIQAFSGEFTLESGKIINNNGYAMRQFGASDITINDGEVKGTRALWIQLAGSNANDAPEVNVTVNDGKLIGTGETDYKLAIYSYSYGNDMRNVNITINDGTIEGDIALTGGKNKTNVETLTINGGTLTDVYSYGDAAQAAQAITINGGSFSSLSPIVYLANECTYTLNSDIENAEPVKFAGNGTLNLNGNTVSAYDDAEKGYALITNNGTLNITGEGTLKITGAANDRGWSAYSSVISNSTNGILTVDENVTIEHLGGTDMAYGIDNLTNGKGTSAIVTINGATVKSTYRPIRQFLNGVEATNELYVNKDSRVESTGGNKAIWMQDPSKNANKGTLTVESGAKVHSVYLDVTEGSTEWPVEVSVAASSLTDQSENKGMYTENVPAGYSVVNENGVWKVIYTCAAKIGDEEYNSLQAAIEAVEDGETIVLQRDVNITTPAYGQNALNHAKAVNFTLDLNGKTISADTGNSVFRYNISQTDATSNITVTFKNGTITSGDNTWCTVMAAGTSNDVKAIFNLENLTINASKAGDLAVKAWDYAVINAKDVTINATKCAGGFYAVGGEIVLDNCTVNQKGLHTAPYMSMAIAVSTKGKLTVNSGNYSTEPTATAEGYNQGTSHGSWCAGVMNSGGELIINGGTFANGNFGDDALATHARGLIFGDTASKIVINDGTFNALKTVIDYQNNLGVQPNPNIVINGGNFSANPAIVTSYGGVVLAEGKVAAQGADGRWTLVDGVVDEAGLKAAFEQGGNIVLGADITVAEPVVLAEGKTAVLDLNGKKIVGGFQANSTTKHIYTLDVYGSLTICDSSNGGYIEGRGNFVRNGATFTVNSGAIYGIDSNGGSAIYQYGGDVVINGGLIEQKAEGTYNFAVNGLGGTVTVNGGKIAGNHGAIATGAAKVILNAGEFVCTGTSGMTDNVLYSYDSGSITINGGTFIADNDGPAGGCCVYDANGGVTINGGVFGNSSGGDVWGTTGTTIKGGKFENLIEKQHIAKGYELNANGEVVAK